MKADNRVNDNINGKKEIIGDYNKLENFQFEDLDKNQNKMQKILINKKFLFPNFVWLIIILLIILVLILILIIKPYDSGKDESKPTKDEPGNCEKYTFKTIYHSNFDNEEISLINPFFEDNI